MKIAELLPDWMDGIIIVDGQRVIVQYKFISSEYIACRDGDGIVVRLHCSKLVGFKISE